MSEKYNIFQLTSSSDIGGTERMLLNLLTHIDSERFGVFVCSLIGSRKLTERLKELGYPAYTLNLRHPLQFRKMHRLYRLLKSCPFDLIQTYGLRADIFGRILARWAQIPLVVSSIRSPDPWRRWYHVFLDRVTLRYADYFVSNSAAGKESRIKREKYPPERTSVIYNGIDPPPHYAVKEIESLRAKYGITGETHPVVAVIANLRVMKGHREVIQAILSLREKFPGILFLFAGRDDSGGEVERLAREAGVSENIRFLGYCPEPVEVLTVSDAFLLPSYWEGCPTSLLEAMAQKIPCIATRVGGIPEIISDRENGILISPKAPDAIADALTFIFENPVAAKKMAESAAFTIMSRFSLQRMVREYEDLYAKLIEEKRAR